MALSRLLRRKKFVNVNELTEIFGVSRRSIWRFKAAGQIPEPRKMRDKSSGSIKTVWKTSQLRRWIARGCPGADTIQLVSEKPIGGMKISNKLLRGKEFLHVSEMVEFLGVSRRSLWRFKKAKQIPAPQKIREEPSGRIRVVWKTDKLRQWVEKGCPSADAIGFSHKHPILAAMLSYKHRRQRILSMRNRIIKKKSRR